MIFDKVVDLLKKVIEYGRVGGYERRLGAVAASEVLGGYDRNRVAVLRLHQQYLAVIVGKIRPLNNLGDERPKFERLVRRLVVENKVDARNFLILADKEQAAEKFFGNGKRSLPNFRHADLR